MLLALYSTRVGKCILYWVWMYLAMTMNIMKRANVSLWILYARSTLKITLENKCAVYILHTYCNKKKRIVTADNEWRVNPGISKHMYAHSEGLHELWLSVLSVLNCSVSWAAHILGTNSKQMCYSFSHITQFNVLILVISYLLPRTSFLSWKTHLWWILSKPF